MKDNVGAFTSVGFKLFIFWISFLFLVIPFYYKNTNYLIFGSILFFIINFKYLLNLVDLLFNFKNRYSNFIQKKYNIVLEEKQKHIIYDLFPQFFQIGVLYFSIKILSLIIEYLSAFKKYFTVIFYALIIYMISYLTNISCEYLFLNFDSENTSSMLLKALMIAPLINLVFSNEEKLLITFFNIFESKESKEKNYWNIEKKYWGDAIEYAHREINNEHWIKQYLTFIEKNVKIAIQSRMKHKKTSDITLTITSLSIVISLVLLLNGKIWLSLFFLFFSLLYTVFILIMSIRSYTKIILFIKFCKNYTKIASVLAPKEERGKKKFLNKFKHQSHHI